MKLLDLFSGIGGFSYGLEKIGFKTIAFCEMDKYCKLVLQKHWKGVKIYNDVKEITKERLEADGVEAPDIITGGFPCQPFSVAGKQKGTSDDRYLWPEMFRIIKELKPRWVIGENVKGLINLQDGLVFETVCTDLEGEGYEVRAFNIPAAGVGAPHRRERIWIVAHAKRYNEIQQIQRSNGTQDQIQSKCGQEDNTSRVFSRTSSIRQTNHRYEDMANANINGTKRNQPEDRQGSRTQQSGEDVANTKQSRSFSKSIGNIGSVGEKIKREEKGGNQSSIRTSTRSTDVANATSKGLERQFGSKLQGTRERFTHGSQTINGDVANADSERQQKQWRSESIQEEVSRQTTGTRSECESGWSVEPNVGRVANGVPGRVHRLKGLGNSIVPQIAEEIGKAIMKAENEME